MCAGNSIENMNVSIESNLTESNMSLIKNDTLSINNNKKEIKRDALGYSTYLTKVLLLHCNNAVTKIQNYYYCKLLLRTTQPAHIITIISVLVLANMLFPTETKNEMEPPPAFLKLLHLGCFAAHFGVQIWMTFVNGLALYLALPRHTFGSVQKVLFPKYFVLNAMLSLIVLFTFLKHQSEIWSDQVVVQVAALVTCFCVELTIRLYLTPALLQLITEKNLMEIQAGVGMEIGDHKPGCLVNCPVYVQLHSSFRKVHMTIAIGNLITMACTVLHLNYLSDRICI